MKLISIIIMFIGFLLAVISMQMNVTVTSEYGTVNNIGLLADRQNYIIISALIILSGIALLFISSNAAPKTQSIKCPFCAEEILPEALICKHCKTDLSSIKKAEYLNEQELSNLIDKINKKT